MKEIILTQNVVALVDDEDYKKLSSFKWYAWHGNKNENYARRSVLINGKKITLLMHRVIMDCPPHTVIDHIDGNGLNNRKSNLRICSNQQNMRNQRVRKFRKYKGTHYQNHKWSSRISCNKRQYHLGVFDTEIEAAIAYNHKATELFGEFALLNTV